MKNIVVIILTFGFCTNAIASSKCIALNNFYILTDIAGQCVTEMRTRKDWKSAFKNIKKCRVVSAKKDIVVSSLHRMPAGDFNTCAASSFRKFQNAQSNIQKFNNIEIQYHKSTDITRTPEYIYGNSKSSFYIKDPVERKKKILRVKEKQRDIRGG